MYNKVSVLVVLGCLIKKPMLFLDDKYDISEKDFAERFHIILFAAIKNLYLSGIQDINAIEIDTYLTQFPLQKKVFEDNNGLQYIDNLIKISRLENFEYHYNVLKKYTLLRNLQLQGIDTTCFIDDNIVDTKKAEAMMQKFDNMTVNDILTEVEKKLLIVKEEFYHSSNEAEQQAGLGMEDLVNSYKLSPEIGVPTNSNILNTICRGMRKKKLYLDSRPSGTFKSRNLVGNCAKISIPYFYDTENNKWKHTNFTEKSLFITTELEIEEVQTMLIAYVSGVSETNILDGNYMAGQEERVKQAIKYIEESNVYIVHLPNYSIEDIERTIKKYQIMYDVGYIFFDYIFTTPKMMSEMGRLSNGVKVREDSVLLYATTRLKDLCNELNVHISTCTQVSDGWQQSKYPDASLIRGCKGMADKCDFAAIVLPVSKEELELLQPILSKNMYPTPNLCYHIYKVRRGSYNKIRLYMYFDGATCRTTELFATDNECKYKEITGTNIEKILDDTTYEIIDKTEEDCEVVKEVKAEDLPF